MNENVRLLMEETGCDQGEAELALELSNHDLQMSVRTIGSLLKHISAIKAKFSFPQKNLYGLMLVIVNTKSNQIIRLRTVVSYNPAIFENSPSMDWYALEKQIFSYRLDEGSLPDFTQSTEHKLESFLNEKKDVLIRGEKEEIKKLFTDFMSPDEIVTEIELEQLNLDQFRKLPEDGVNHNQTFLTPEKDYGTVLLDIELVQDENGKEIDKLEEGDSVLTMITDARDIAHYLAHLIGDIQEGKMLPIPAIVKRVTNIDQESEIHTSFTPNIIGIAKASSKMKVKVLEEKGQAWWKRIMPFRMA